MDSILRIAASVHTPLALGGLIAGILFLVFRQIIAKDIFGSLAGPDTKDVIVRVIDKLFYLALVAVVLGFVAYILPKVVTARGGQISPDYVDVGLDADKSLEEVITKVAAARNVTVVIPDQHCQQNVHAAVLEKGDHSGNNMKEFLENLKDRVKGSGINYTVRQEGARRYEIVCN